MIAAGLGYGYPEKIKAMTEEALPTYEWTVKELVFSTTTKSVKKAVTLFLVTSTPSTVPDLKLFRNSLHTPRILALSDCGSTLKGSFVMKTDESRGSRLEGYRFPTHSPAELNSSKPARL